MVSDDFILTKSVSSDGCIVLGSEQQDNLLEEVNEINDLENALKNFLRHGTNETMVNNYFSAYDDLRDIY